jgi:hypothetical protein
MRADPLAGLDAGPKVPRPPLERDRWGNRHTRQQDERVDPDDSLIDRSRCDHAIVHGLGGLGAGLARQPVTARPGVSGSHRAARVRGVVRHERAAVGAPSTCRSRGGPTSATTPTSRRASPESTKWKGQATEMTSSRRLSPQPCPLRAIVGPRPADAQVRSGRARLPVPAAKTRPSPTPPDRGPSSVSPPRGRRRSMGAVPGTHAAPARRYPRSIRGR